MRELLVNCAIHGGAERPACARVYGEVVVGNFGRFVIEDDGPGIAPDQTECIFEPFKRANGRGAGMGLAIGRRIVIRHGGTIHAEPGEPSGTRIVFTLPKARPEDTLPDVIEPIARHA
jgi:signal transduction histidine kinase